MYIRNIKKTHLLIILLLLFYDELLLHYSNTLYNTKIFLYFSQTSKNYTGFISASLISYSKSAVY